MTSVDILKCGDCLELSRWSLCNHKGPSNHKEPGKKIRIREEGNVLMEAEGGKAFGCRALSQGMRTASRVWKGKEMDSFTEPQEEPACPNTSIFIPLRFTLESGLQAFKNGFVLF